MLAEWVEKQNQLIDFERDTEINLLNEKISSLSPKNCQADGLSILNLEINESRTALFGRCCLTLQRLDKGQIQQSFKVGDEITLYNPKNYSNAAVDSLLLGLISKISLDKIEIIVDEFDDHYFDPPLRMDLRASQKTHSTMKAALNALQEEGSNHPLVNLLFFPNDSNSHLLQLNPNVKLRQPLWNLHLNDSQQRAVLCALSAPAISVIHGPPGTGKTSTLTELILQAVSIGWKVLVCAPSNIAVDTILARLAEYQHVKGRFRKQTIQSYNDNANQPLSMNSRSSVAIDMVRLGHPARISPKIMHYALDSIIARDEGTEIVKDVRTDIDKLRTAINSKRNGRKKEKKSSSDTTTPEYCENNFNSRKQQRVELRALCKEAKQREKAVVQKILQRCNVVLCTCVGAGSKILNQINNNSSSSSYIGEGGDRMFDLVVIDEAAQGLEAACWIPILKARRCVLAGDHCQLPPTIKSRDAEKGGLAVTLFERIINDKEPVIAPSSSIYNSDSDMKVSSDRYSVSRFHSVVRLLDTQYRMNKLISDWASHAMYHDAIQSHASVADHTLNDIILPSSTATTSVKASSIVGTSDNNDDEEEEEDICEVAINSVNKIAMNHIATTAEDTKEQSIVDNSNNNSNDDDDVPTFPVMLLVDTSGYAMMEENNNSNASSNNTNKAGISSLSLSSHQSHRNYHEAELVRQHVMALVQAGIRPNQIGVITPYNGQLEVLRELLIPLVDEDNIDAVKTLSKKNNKSKERSIPMTAAGTSSLSLRGLEVKTIDGFQGGEKECILISLVRSNTSREVGFLGEHRRINVAVTRAKRHLAVFCDTNTCSADPFMRGLINHITENGDHLNVDEFEDYYGITTTAAVLASGSNSNGHNNNHVNNVNTNILAIKSISNTTVSFNESNANENSNRNNRQKIDSTTGNNNNNKIEPQDALKVSVERSDILCLLLRLRNENLQMLQQDNSNSDNNNSIIIKKKDGAQYSIALIASGNNGSNISCDCNRDNTCSQNDIGSKQIVNQSTVKKEKIFAELILTTAEAAAAENSTVDNYPNHQLQQQIFLLKFSSSLTSYQRMIVHDCAEELNLPHCSLDDGKDTTAAATTANHRRYVQVSIPYESHSSNDCGTSVVAAAAAASGGGNIATLSNSKCNSKSVDEATATSCLPVINQSKDNVDGITSTVANTVVTTTAANKTIKAVVAVPGKKVNGKSSSDNSKCSSSSSNSSSKNKTKAGLVNNKVYVSAARQEFLNNLEKGYTKQLQPPHQPEPPHVDRKPSHLVNHIEDDDNDSDSNDNAEDKETQLINSIVINGNNNRIATTAVAPHSNKVVTVVSNERHLKHAAAVENKKQQPSQLSEDELINEAILHNERLARYNQYRVTGSAVPNPDKIQSKQKLHSKLQEAASNRAKQLQEGASQSKSGNNNTGGVGGNIFGLHTSDTTDTTSSSSNSNGGSNTRNKKKVLKKPVPNFGGGRLGSS